MEAFKMADRNAGFEQSIPAQLRFFDPSYVGMVGDFYACWFQGAIKVSQEIAEIAQTRIKDDIAAWAKLATCRDPKEFVDYQRNRAQQVADDVAKVSGMITSMMQDATMKKAA
jgi:Phasin protein